MERERTKEPHRLPNGANHGCVMNSDKCMNNNIAPQQHTPSLFRDAQQPASSPSLPRQQASKDSLTILHFNDVYNIEGRDREPVGGAARFKTCLDKFSYLRPLTLFSGDALSPSNSELGLCLWSVVVELVPPPKSSKGLLYYTNLHVLYNYFELARKTFSIVPKSITTPPPPAVSVVMKGEQMVPVLNSLNIQCAVYGNHDFGRQLISQGA